MFKQNLIKALIVSAVVFAPFAAQAQIIKCKGKDGKTYVGSTLPPQCAGQSTEQMNKQGMVVKRTDAMLSPEQRAAKEAEEQAAKEKKTEADRKEKEEARQNKALLSTYGSEKDIEIARSSALKDNETAVQRTQDKIAQIQKNGAMLDKRLAAFKGEKKPTTQVEKDIKNNQIDLKAQQDLLAAKKKDVEIVNARYDEYKRRFVELTKAPAVSRAPK